MVTAASTTLESGWPQVLEREQGLATLASPRKVGTEHGEPADSANLVA